MGTDSKVTLTVVLPFVACDRYSAIGSIHHISELSNTRAVLTPRAAFATKRGRCGRRVGVPVGSDAAMQ